MNLSTKIPLLLTAALAATVFCCATPDQEQTATIAAPAAAADSSPASGPSSWVPALVASFRVEGMQKNAAGGT